MANIKTKYDNETKQQLVTVIAADRGRLAVRVRLTQAAAAAEMVASIPLIIYFINFPINETKLRKTQLNINFLFSVRIIADIPEVSAASSSAASTTTTSAATVKTKITAPSPTSNGTNSNALSRNLWVSGLSPLTRATDLKMIFSKFGKVIGAKVVTNTRTPGQKCFGYVTMANAKDATECISNLHRTELHGRKISVERAKSDLGSGPPKSNGNSSAASKTSDAKTTSADKKKENDSSAKKAVTSRDSDRKDSRKTYDEKSKDPKSSSSSSAKPERKRISPPRTDSSKDQHKSKPREGAGDKPRPIRSTSTTRKEREALSLSRIREERERKRLRDLERELHEQERKRREIRRRQREEEQRLQREREKLALERRRIEEQKAELLRIERERQKLERDKIELERLELKRQQRKYDYPQMLNLPLQLRTMNLLWRWLSIHTHYSTKYQVTW